MSGDAMFAVVWLSMASTVYAWGAIMIVACRTLGIRVRKAVLLDDCGGADWMTLTVLTVFLPFGIGVLAHDAVQLHRKVTREDGGWSR